MSMDLGSGKGGVKSDINVTPLVDIMMLLQKGVNVKLPTASNTVDKPETQEQTVVAVQADGRMFLNALEVPEDDLARRVTEALEAKRERIVLIKADEDAQYGRIMAAMDALRKAQIEDMGLITERRVRPGEETGGN